MFNAKEFQDKVDKIIKDYLYNISMSYKHNYFKNGEVVKSRTKYFQSQGFDILDLDKSNYYVVKEEMFLEGCTRVFLINPIIKLLLDKHEIKNDWKNGDTFGNYTIGNREYELGNFIEFIAVLDGKNVGVRYTKASYSSEEIYAMKRDNGYLFGKAQIPGFENLRYVDKLYAIDWSGIANDELDKIHRPIENGRYFFEDISINNFFGSFFSNEEYDEFIKVTQKAISRAKDIIALRAVPQLLPNNIFQFKKVIQEEFSDERVINLAYEFQDEKHIYSLSEEDINIIKHNFSTQYRNALIGNSDFAKSFITSEYLFRIIQGGLSIDYTAIVAGYLKSIEQLLYLIYLYAFEGKSKISYWDKCNKKENFDISDTSRYRYDPYGNEKQEKYFHKKKRGSNAPNFGELTRFLRYFDKIWRISESGKEYVYECLNDFIKYSRNSHFHKDNINASDYDLVKRIRNNTHVCLYYLLGGFRFLDKSSSIENKLEINKWDFEEFYFDLMKNRQKWFDVSFDDEENIVLGYLKDDDGIEYNENGELNDARLHFLKVGRVEDNIYVEDAINLMNNPEYVNENSLYITKKNMPREIKPIKLNKRGKSRK